MTAAPALTFLPVHDGAAHLAPTVADAVAALGEKEAVAITVAPIDPDHADTATFCEVYDWDAR